MKQSLPIDDVIPQIKTALKKAASVVIQAPPGAGKTTVVPLALLDEAWVGKGRIIMLEPRRLATRAAARRMARLLGEKVGERVGYRVRMDSMVSDKTRIEVVTEGILTRRLQADPELHGVSAVIFDEYHERSLQADLGLALCLDVQRGLREDLKLIVMSATLDGARVADLLKGDAADTVPLITSEGRAYPVAIKYHDTPLKDLMQRRGQLENAMARKISEALADQGGSILAFLPGAGEIERTADLLGGMNLGPEVIIAPLYGKMTGEMQDRAIAPAPKGQRKVVLATSIAETSLTIEGIRMVVDSGLARGPHYDAKTGMTRLETRKLSRASAEQRAGRAGRMEAGICYRLWREAQQGGLKAFDAPEITQADLVPLVLELCQWGLTDPEELSWADPPDKASYAQALDLLCHLGALDQNHRITAHGTAMAGLAMHPRLAHMVLKARDYDLGQLAVLLAALMNERDILRSPEVDIRLRLEILNRIRNKNAPPALLRNVDRPLCKTILQQVRRWQQQLGLKNGPIEPNKAGLCIAMAYPERIGSKRKNDFGKFLLSGGRGALLKREDALAVEKYIAVSTLDRGQRDARIFLAAPVDQHDLEAVFADQIKETENIEWNPREKAVTMKSQRLLGKLCLKEKPLENADPEKIVSALMQGIRQMGLGVLPWDKKSISLRERINFIRAIEGDNGLNDLNDLPDLRHESLLATLEQWLGPYVTGIKTAEQLKKLKMADIISASLSWQDQQYLDRMAPSHLKVPSGSNIAIDYSQNPPVLSVKLQEMFGQSITPCIMEGRVALLIHLLSPAGRPLQVTQDLAGFWKSSYELVKKDMKGRYPKHHWPDDPLSAPPSRKTKKATKNDAK